MAPAPARPRCRLRYNGTHAMKPTQNEIYATLGREPKRAGMLGYGL
jgi:hypothetical protein